MEFSAKLKMEKLSVIWNDNNEKLWQFFVNIVITNAGGFLGDKKVELFLYD